MSRHYSVHKFLLILACGMVDCVAQPSSPYEIIVTHNVLVAAPDGVRLATDVYLPGRGGATTGRFPVIVERTPYNKETTADVLAKYFVPRGYAVIMQDVRGRYKSGGKWRPLKDDGPDGAALLKWITQQPWSNGKIGTVGTSYAGATQHAIGITNAPGLAAMVPVDAMSNAGQFGVRHNGAFELRWLNWILTLGNATGTRASATGLTRSLTRTPFTPGLTSRRRPERRSPRRRVVSSPSPASSATSAGSSTSTTATAWRLATRTPRSYWCGRARS